MKKYLIPALLVIGIIAAYWASFGNPVKKIFPGTPPLTDPEAGTNAAPPVNGSFIPNADIKQDAKGFPMSIGSRGIYVQNMQQALNDKFGSSLAVDGVFGTKTATALSAHGFNPDAIFWKHYFEIIA